MKDNSKRIKDLEKFQERISFIEQSTKNLSWKAEDVGGDVLIGMYDDIPLFRITRGTLIYTLHILDEKVKERNQIKFSTSTQLNRLKNKADGICQAHYIPFNTKQK